MKTKLISSLKIIGVELLGSILIAVGIYNFAAASAFPMTGFSGIALIFNRLFALPVGLTIIVLNVPVAALCYKLLGKTVLSAFRALYGHLINYDRLSCPPVPGIHRKQDAGGNLHRRAGRAGLCHYLYAEFLYRRHRLYHNGSKSLKALLIPR